MIRYLFFVVLVIIVFYMTSLIFMEIGIITQMVFIAFFLLLCLGVFLSCYFFNLFGFSPYKYKRGSEKAERIIIKKISSLKISPKGLRKKEQ